MPLRRRTAAGLLGAACLVPAAAARAAPERVVVASKIDTEGALLGAMVLLVLQAAGVPVVDRLQLGPTRIVRAALLAGEVDIYPEYTGNGALANLGRQHTVHRRWWGKPEGTEGHRSIWNSRDGERVRGSALQFVEDLFRVLSPVKVGLILVVVVIVDT